MENVQQEYKRELERQISLVCRDTIGAIFDFHMFMFPKAFWHKNQNTRMYYYTWYAIRLRTVVSVRKLIEPAGKNKVNIKTIVDLVTLPENTIISDKEKKAVLADFETLFNSEHTKRIKRFRDSVVHSVPNNDEILCYYKDFMYILNGAMYILEALYIIVFKKEPTFFYEIRDIALELSNEYWSSLSNVAGNAKENQKINTRLYQLLDGKF